MQKWYLKSKQPPSTPSKFDRTEFSKDMAELLKKHGIQPRVTAEWVYNEVLKITEKVDYGRGEYAKTVTQLMLDMYRNLVGVGLISDAPDKRKLAEIVGLSHDIGVGPSNLPLTDLFG